MPNILIWKCIFLRMSVGNVKWFLFGSFLPLYPLDWVASCSVLFPCSGWSAPELMGAALCWSTLLLCCSDLAATGDAPTVLLSGPQFSPSAAPCWRPLLLLLLDTESEDLSTCGALFWNSLLLMLVSGDEYEDLDLLSCCSPSGALRKRGATWWRSSATLEFLS